MKMDY